MAKNRCPATNHTGHSIEARNRNMDVQCQYEKGHDGPHRWARGRDRIIWSNPGGGFLGKVW